MSLTDLEHWKIDAHVSPEFVTEIHILNDLQTGQRRVPTPKTWRIGPVVGRGGFGEVRRETCVEDSRVRAVKRLEVDSNSLKEDREIHALLEFSKRKYRDAAVFVEFFGWFEDQHRNVYLAMEYLPHGDLETYARTHEPLREAEIKNLSAQILEGLQIMHRESIAHRDLKPQNILICTPSPDWWIKLADFGLSKRADDETTVMFAGTAGYMAPERLQYVTRGDKTAVDIWALGCIIYRLAGGVVPFSLTELLSYCSTGIFPRPQAELSDAGLAFVQSLLNPDPTLRPNAEQASQKFWIADHDTYVTAQAAVATAETDWYQTDTHPALKSLARLELSEKASHRQPHASGASEEEPPPEDTIMAQYAVGPELEEKRGSSVPAARTVPNAKTRFRLLTALTGHNGEVRSVAISPDGQLVATASRDSTAKIWRAKDGWTARTLPGHVGAVNDVAFSPDGRVIATASGDYTTRFWDVTTGLRQQQFIRQLRDVNSVAFAPGGELIATGGGHLNELKSATASLWAADTAARRQTLTGHRLGITAVAFSSDGLLIATASVDSTARVWGVGSGHVYLMLPDHAGPVRAVAFSPDNRLIATASDDKKAKLWYVSSGGLIMTMKGHKREVRGVAFSPNGRLLATASADKTTKLWDVATGALVQTLKAHRGEVNGVAFSADGLMLATASSDCTAMLWEVDASTTSWWRRLRN